MSFAFQDNSLTVNIRSIQHFMYCPHRWGLLEMNCDWAENASVIKADIIHENVHSGKHRFSAETKVYTSVEIFNDDPKINIFGVADCIEIKGKTINIIEYKPTAPKDGAFRYDDSMQLFAQKICVDKIFNCFSNTYLYYADIKKRIRVNFDDDYEKYYSKLTDILREIRLNLLNETIPLEKTSKNCSGCSLKDCCLPIKRTRGNVKESIYSQLNCEV